MSKLELDDILNSLVEDHIDFSAMDGDSARAWAKDLRVAKQQIEHLFLEIIGPDKEPVYGIANVGSQAQVTGDVNAIENILKAELREKVKAL